MKIKSGSIESRIDYSVILPTLFLLIIGVLAVFVAVSQDYPNHVATIVGQQVMWMFLGAILAFLVMFFSTKFLWQVTPLLYLLGLGLMVLPLFL